MFKTLSLYVSVIFLLITFSYCAPDTQHFKFDEIECNPEPMPEFDERQVGILDDNGNVHYDTVISRIVKHRTVFKPCRQMIYRAIFKSANGDEISNSQIRMTALGQRWAVQPRMQDAIVVQYETSEQDQKSNNIYQLNRSLSHHWNIEDETGIIENAEEIWMHPFRKNQFNFTEVAAFPRIKYPLELKRSYTGGIGGMSGWGDWDGYSGSDLYTIVGYESIDLPCGEVDSCWVVNTSSQWDFGESFLKFWFHEDLGFVKMDYINYGNQTLSIELEKIIE